jgi:hypothetical protein
VRHLKNGRNYRPELSSRKSLFSLLEIQKVFCTTKPITIEKEVYRSEPLSQYGMMGLITTMFALSMFFGLNQFIPVKISNDFNNYLQAIWSRTGFTNTKLQRVERYLGTDPNRKR